MMSQINFSGNVLDLKNVFGYTTPLFVLINIGFAVWRRGLVDISLLLLSALGLWVNFLILREFANP